MVPQLEAGDGEQLIPAIRPSGLNFALIMCSFSHRVYSGVKLCSLVLILAGKCLEQMEVSVNSLILLGLSYEALPGYKKVKSRPFQTAQPGLLQFSISYFSQSTPFLTR